MFAIAVAIWSSWWRVIGLDLVRPLREISAAVQRRLRPATPEPSPNPVEGNDILAQLAESHNRLPRADAERRQPGSSGSSTRQWSRRSARRPRGPGPSGGTRRRARPSAHLGRASLRRPGQRRSRGSASRACRPDPRELRAGDERLGSSSPASPPPRRGSAPTRRSSTLYASEIGVALGTPSCFEQVQEPERPARRAQAR
jgi:hypothetical protein